MTSLLENALERLRAEFFASRRAAQFEHLRQFLQSEADDSDYARVAGELGMTQGAVAVAVHRLRQRYRDLVRAEITQTVSSAEELADEWRHLFGPGIAADVILRSGFLLIAWLACVPAVQSFVA